MHINNLNRYRILARTERMSSIQPQVWSNSSLGIWIKRMKVLLTSNGFELGVHEDRRIYVLPCDFVKGEAKRMEIVLKVVQVWIKALVQMPNLLTLAIVHKGDVIFMMYKIEASNVHAHFPMLVIHINEVWWAFPQPRRVIKFYNSTYIEIWIMFLYSFCQTLHVITICSQNLQCKYSL